MENHSGFSLIEIMVTIAVVAVTSIFSFPSIQSWQKKELVNGEVRQIVSSLMNAKFAAIKHNSFVVVQFKKSGYSVFVDDGANGGRAKDWIRQAGENEISNHINAEGLTLSTNFPSDRMRFRGRIGVKAGTVILSNAGKKDAKVILSMAGRVRVEKL